MRTELPDAAVPVPAMMFSSVLPFLPLFPGKRVNSRVVLAWGLMRFLVTGSQGCIGAWVVKALLDRGCEVICYDLESDLTRLGLISGQTASPRLRLVTGRIEDTEIVKRLVAEKEITHIVHLAAVLMPFCQSNPVAGGMIDVIGTLNVFEAARDAGRPVRVVYASSSAVWGPDDAYGGRTLSEVETPLPSTHYGVFKQANEGNARAFYLANGISSVGLRPWTVYRSEERRVGKECRSGWSAEQ